MVAALAITSVASAQLRCTVTFPCGTRDYVSERGVRPTFQGDKVIITDRSTGEIVDTIDCGQVTTSSTTTLPTQTRTANIGPLNVTAIIDVERTRSGSSGGLNTSCNPVDQPEPVATPAPAATPAPVVTPLGGTVTDDAEFVSSFLRRLQSRIPGFQLRGNTNLNINGQRFFVEDAAGLAADPSTAPAPVALPSIPASVPVETLAPAPAPVAAPAPGSIITSGTGPQSVSIDESSSNQRGSVGISGNLSLPNGGTIIATPVLEQTPTLNRASLNVTISSLPVTNN